LRRAWFPSLGAIPFFRIDPGCIERFPCIVWRERHGAVVFLTESNLKPSIPEEHMIKNGSVVSFEYTLSDDDGKVIESNKGETPVTYTQGKNQIIPGLELGFLGMALDEEKRIRVEPEDAYGPVDPGGFKEVSRSEIPEKALAVGTMLRARGPKGEDFSVRVHEIKPETVILDLNHPLAGKTLNFDVKVVDVQADESQ
jgi:FKBP-type peptidyl-prolyl cis-trans isomerase SlyD